MLLNTEDELLQNNKLSLREKYARDALLLNLPSTALEVASEAINGLNGLKVQI